MRLPSPVTRVLLLSCGVLILPALLFSQQYPISTETPTILAAGTAHAEFGVGEYFDQPFPLSGLDGTLTKVGIVRFGFSYDSNVELQFDGTLLDILRVQSRHPAFNSAVTTSDSVTADIGDFTLWTKFCLVSEQRFFCGASIRLGVQLPNASNESGLGIDEFDFYSSFLFEKHYAGIRWVVNTGLGILGDPALLSEQHDTFIFAFGSYVPVGEKSTLVFEAAGRTGHHGIGVYRLANAKAGAQIPFMGFDWRLQGVMSFAPSDNSRGIELLVHYNATILSNDARR